ncbi:Mini-ribonuclease 3 [Clostridium intestinale]|uniref:Mini-ribonuclease 3 n=1 Tax=Clostridium intestinale DSM 6191 TaxID=1121320 RepID=A0A1M6EUG6_9CLOT|nr:ribonuclease III domain-containing protein [Clostridium intestinale]SHI89052.1 ribonuclease-3 family protein [Clostridium intestinale DSM 6191]
MENLLYRKFAKEEARMLNPLQLAFVGDGVYEVFIRNYILNNNKELSTHKLHVEAIKYVKAHAQSEIIRRIESDLTEEEIYIYKRGRNTKSATVPKNADLAEYRAATGFEALVGYLYLINEIDRLNTILLKSVEQE